MARDDGLWGKGRQVEATTGIWAEQDDLDPASPGTPEAHRLVNRGAVNGGEWKGGEFTPPIGREARELPLSPAN